MGGILEVTQVSTITELSNNGLHQTGRGGVAFAFRRRPVVEARPAGEAQCCAGVSCRGIA
jgi:hypothetical protein